MLKNLSWNRKSLVPDLMSGLTVALVSIPEGMAYALVAGVDPVYGLYNGMVTTIVAALTGSTSFMIVTLTNALALVMADALGGLSSDTDPIPAMFTLTLLVGVVMFLLGVLKLGSVIRFVSKEVMSGFVCHGVARRAGAIRRTGRLCLTPGGRHAGWSISGGGAEVTVQIPVGPSGPPQRARSRRHDEKRSS